MNTEYTVEVCLTPALFDGILTQGECIIVLADILRATTSICYAFSNGVSSVIPVASLDEARALKEKGYLVASEQDGKKLDFADFGNSAFSFTRERIGGKTLAYCTTNGTRALDIAKSRGPVAIGAFSNLTALKNWITGRQRNIVILCSGWKNHFCLEDTLFAGALAQMLVRDSGFHPLCDAVHASMDLYDIAKNDLVGYIEKAMHRQRLRKLELDDVIPFSFLTDQTDVVPVFNGTGIINMNPPFRWQAEQFGDIKILRYRVPGFEELPLKQKELIYYLSQAALYGRDITFDQNCRYNLRCQKNARGHLRSLYRRQGI